MARIFLVRHAESLANSQGIYQGQSYDTDLSDLGRSQAAALAHRFQGQNLDAVYTSPLKRTRQTAAGLNQAIIEDPVLLETDHGDWEGLSKETISTTWPNLYNLWLKNPSQVTFPGGEKYPRTQARAITWFDQIRSTNQTVLAVTHSNIIMCLIAHINNKPLDAMWNYAMQPTAVTLIESHSPAKIIYLNDISHLNDLKSDLSRQAI